VTHSGWVILFVNKQALEEFEALSASLRAKLQRIFHLVEELGLSSLTMPLASPLRYGLWEMRVRGKDGIARSLYIAIDNKKLLILKTFVKKTTKTPESEISMARQRLTQFNLENAPCNNV